MTGALSMRGGGAARLTGHRRGGPDGPEIVYRAAPFRPPKSGFFPRRAAGPAVTPGRALQFALGGVDRRAILLLSTDESLRSWREVGTPFANRSRHRAQRE